jgi:biopolymer transport protein ExbD
MSLIPEEELRSNGHVNLAPMVDFLFLVLAVFAVLAITRTALFDADISLVKLKSSEDKLPAKSSETPYFVNISVKSDGSYSWIAESQQFVMENVLAIQHELIKQQQLGLLPDEKERIKVLLHIDKGAQWEPISKVIFGVREDGFNIHPVYEPKTQ